MARAKPQVTPEVSGTEVEVAPELPEVTAPELPEATPEASIEEVPAPSEYRKEKTKSGLVIEYR